MNEGYVIPEETQAVNEKRVMVVEQLFDGILSPEDGAHLYDRGLRNIEYSLTGISDDHLSKFAEKYDRELIAEYEDVQTEDDVLISEDRYAKFNAYNALRSTGFSHSEISTLCVATANGDLEFMLSEKVAHERVMVNEFVAQSQETIKCADQELMSFAKQVKGENGIYQKPQAIFTGKYQNLMIFSGSTKEENVTPSDSSIYSSGENVVLVHIKDIEGYQEFDDAKMSGIMHTYVHENIHGIAENTIVKGDEYLPLNPMLADSMHSGFFHSDEDNTHHRLFNMNEATTEYFARQLSRKAGIEGFAGTYQPQVECLEKLFAYLEEDDGIDVREREQTLAIQYGSPDGIESLRMMIEEKIGPHGLEISDMLFDITDEFEQFLSGVRQMKNGKQEDNELWVSLSRLQSHCPEISPSQIHDAYPFLHVGVRAYDEATQKITWKEVE